MGVSSRENNGGNGRGKHPLCSFTPTEQKIMDALIDRQPHLKQDVVREVGEGDWSDDNLHAHLTNMRLKLPAGHEIICQLEGRRHYIRYIVYT